MTPACPLYTTAVASMQLCKAMGSSQDAQIEHSLAGNGEAMPAPGLNSSAWGD